MRKVVVALVLTIAFFNASAQAVDIGIFAGTSNYQGDLVDKAYVARFTKPALGLTVAYELSGHLSLRAGLTYASLTGDDKYNTKEYLQARNLNFTTKLSEASLTGEYALFDLTTTGWTPYAFAGIAVYHFNPYTHYQNNKVYLPPLSTEGEGLPQYAAKRYALTQVAIPFGGGIKWALNDRFRLGLEVGVRKLFSDYLDDVSTNYADAAELAAYSGPLAVALAYRGDEVPSGNPAYPSKGAQRGGAAQKDWYYFTGLHITYRLADVFSGVGSNRGGKGYGCPVNF